MAERTPVQVTIGWASRLSGYAQRVRQYLATKLPTSPLRSKFLKGRGNVAIGELEVGGKTTTVPAFSGTDDLDGFAKYVENEKRVLKAGGAGKPGKTFLRDVDAEAKILEKMMQMTTPDSTGTIYLFSELPFCQSCEAMIQNFRKYRPHITLDLAWNGGSEIIPARIP